MIWHQQPLHDLAFHDMAFHDFCDIGFTPDPVPDTLRVDDHARPKLAMIQAAGFVRADAPFQAQPFHLFFKEGVQPFGPLIGAAPAWVAFGSLIDTDKNMMGEGRHESTLYDTAADADKGWP